MITQEMIDNEHGFSIRKVYLANAIHKMNGSSPKTVEELFPPQMVDMIKETWEANTSHNMILQSYYMQLWESGVTPMSGLEEKTLTTEEFIETSKVSNICVLDGFNEFKDDYLNDFYDENIDHMGTLDEINFPFEKTTLLMNEECVIKIEDTYIMVDVIEVVDYSPGDRYVSVYIPFTLVSGKEFGGSQIFSFPLNKKTAEKYSHSRILYDIIIAASAFVNQSKFGSLKENLRVKVKKSKKNKYLYKRNKFIYCNGTKKEKTIANRFANRVTVWDHSWKVRGHWRTAKGFGKDRHGEYNVEGYTWVNNHVKGSGELIDKTRIFKD